MDGYNAGRINVKRICKSAVQQIVGILILEQLKGNILKIVNVNILYISRAGRGEMLHF